MRSLVIPMAGKSSRFPNMRPKWMLTHPMSNRFMAIESILGLKVDKGANRQQLNGVVELLIEIRKQAKANKDFATSDKIRNQLAEMGIQLKDEKDGSMSYSF